MIDNPEIINKAQEYLRRQPVDFVHDLDHHEAVANNCIKIIQAEHLNVNPTIVIIAAWWHDLESKEGATDLLQKEMVSARFDEQTIKATTAIVHSHTYGEQQATTEAKVLFDADKLEYFNPERMKKAVNDAQMGLLPIPVLAKHYRLWLERYENVLNSFNFKYSRELAQQNLADTLAEIGKMRVFLETVGLKD